MSPEAARKLSYYLYRSLLGRDPGVEALQYCVDFLVSGESADALEQQILDSAEFKARRDAHPLAPFPYIYTVDRAPYFMHRELFRPLSLQVETVNICNNDCIFCPYSLQTRTRQTMPMQTFRKIVRDYEEIGGGQLGITPMVGELFLDKLLPERLALLKESALITNVSAITNASMLYRYNDQELSEILSGLSAICVSLYGLDPDEYLQITRKDGYEDMVEGAARLVRLAGPKKVVLYSRQILKRSAEFIAAWRTEMAQRAAVSPEDLRFAAGMTRYANWSVFDTSKPLPGGAQWLERPKMEGQCALPLVSMQIYSNGNVSMCACADFNGDGELFAGNIMEQSLKQILQSERVRKFWNWDTYGVPEFCKSCSFYRPLSILAETPSAFADPLGVFNGFAE